MFEPVLQQFGLSKNEAIIYEALLRHGEMGVSLLSRKSGVHRRNVYDTLQRLVEKGLVFEIVTQRETVYQGVDPKKFREFLQEKEEVLNRALPHMDSLYKQVANKSEVFVYRGPEGWKNYMRDMVRLGDDAYFIGAKGCWLDERVKNFFPQFQKEFTKKNMTFWHIFDHEVKEEYPQILEHIGDKYRFLPAEFSTPCGIDIFGDRVNILSDMKLGGYEDYFSFTVVVNQQIADAFKTWFQFMYQMCPTEK